MKAMKSMKAMTRSEQLKEIKAFCRAERLTELYLKYGLFLQEKLAGGRYKVMVCDGVHIV